MRRDVLNKITDEGPARKYFTMIPNIVDDAGLSVYAFRLYCHLMRVAGDKGECWQSTRTLAEKCNMSPMSVSRAKRELTKAGFIKIELISGKAGRDYHHITVVDIWALNTEAYRPDEKLQSTCEVLQSTPQEEPIKNNAQEGKTKRQRTPRATTDPVAKITPPVTNRSSSFASHSLVKVIKDELKAQEREPNEEAIKAAIAMWQEECARVANDGRTWKPTNLDAILERYDALVLSEDARYGFYAHRLVSSDYPE
jgi:predicted transcriptional regulator